MKKSTKLTLFAILLLLSASCKKDYINEPCDLTTLTVTHGDHVAITTFHNGTIIMDEILHNGESMEIVNSMTDSISVISISGEYTHIATNDCGTFENDPIIINKYSYE